MVKQKGNKWQKEYERLVSQHYRDQRRITRLTNQMHRLMVRSTNIKFSIAQEGQKYVKKIEMMEQLRNQLIKLLRSKKLKMSRNRRENLLRLHLQLPANTLLHRIRLMELLVQLPKSYLNANPRTNWLRLWNEVDRKRQAKSEESLRRMNTQMLRVISDIHDLHYIIDYVKQTKTAKFHVLPALRRMNWLEPKRQSGKRGKRREQLDVRHSYILKNVDQMLPDMYSYLDQSYII